MKHKVRRDTLKFGFGISIMILPIFLFIFEANAESYELVGDRLYPEGIAYRKSNQSFYVGSARDGSLQIVEDGVARFIHKAEHDGRNKTLGIKIDEQRNRLWLLDNENVYIYNLSTYILIKKISILNDLNINGSGMNDLVIDSEGNAYITDSFLPYIYKVNTKSTKITIHRKLEEIKFGNQNGFKYNLNGIVLIENESALLVVKTNDGSIWRVGVKDDDVFELRLSEAVTKGDGLVLDNQNNLYIIRNFENKVSKIKLVRKVSSANFFDVENIKIEGLNIPTTATIDTRNNELVIVNSQFGIEEPDGSFNLSRYRLK